MLIHSMRARILSEREVRAARTPNEEPNMWPDRAHEHGRGKHVIGIRIDWDRGVGALEFGFASLVE